MIRVLLSGLILSCLISASGQDTASAPGPARVAIVSTAETADLAALLTTELSDDKSVTLVERDALTRIGDERKLQSLASRDAAALGKLVNADGLLFLDKQNDDIHVRLTAVALGYGVFDLRIVSGTGAGETAKAVAHRVVTLAPKLTLPPGKAVPLSLLNLRFDVVTPDTAKIERDLTLLLESRLATEPEYVVLERRHAWDLGFEHSLPVPVITPVEEGACILDGTLKLSSEKNTDLHARIRVHLPRTNEEKIAEADGHTDDLPAFSSALAAQINQAMGAPVSGSAWHPQAEAREYLREGIWAWEHDQSQAAIEALDSAELLGETAPDLLAARIPALSLVALPDINPAEDTFICEENVIPILFQHVNPTHYYTPLQPLPDRLAAARRALADLKQYTQTPNPNLTLLDPKRQREVQRWFASNLAIHAASNVLAEMEAKNDPETAAFREEIREAAHFDPLKGKIPDDRGDAAFFADLWAHSMDEELAYYRQMLCAPGPGQYLAVFLKCRFIAEQGKVFCPRFLPESKDQEKAYLDFAQSLMETPEGKLSGLLLLSCFHDKAVSEPAYVQYLDELFRRSSQLFQYHAFEFQGLAAGHLSGGLRAKFGDKAVPALRAYLQNGSGDIRTLQFFWIPSSFPPGEAADIWKDFKDYKARLICPHGPQARYASQENAMFGMFEESFTKAFPQLVTADTGAPPLEITHTWQPSGFRSINECHVRGDTAALRTNSQNFYFLNLADFSSVHTDQPKNFTCYDFDFNADALYAIGFNGSPKDGKSETWRFDRTGGGWSRRETPTSYYGPFVVRDQLYLYLNSNDSRNPALVRYNWDSSESTVLCSARRRPAQNQFDDREEYQIGRVFAGLNQTAGVSIDFNCYTIDDKPGDWPQVIPGFKTEGTFRVGDRTLVVAYQEQLIFLLDPARTQPVLLLAPKGVPLPPAATSYGPARWECDNPTFSKVVDGTFARMSVHNDAFFSVVRHQTAPAHNELIWFEPGRPAPISIPLKFKSGDAKEFDDSLIVEAAAADSGICLWNQIRGLWLLPYEDIEAYMKKTDK